MLRGLNDLEGYAIRATDGLIGHVKDYYFDDEAWVVRYLVVEAGSRLSSRKVLISPVAIGRPNWTDKVLPVSITRNDQGCGVSDAGADLMVDIKGRDKISPPNMVDRFQHLPRPPR